MTLGRSGRVGCDVGDSLSESVEGESVEGANVVGEDVAVGANVVVGKDVEGASVVVGASVASVGCRVGDVVLDDDGADIDSSVIAVTSDAPMIIKGKKE